ncbi:IS110 family transposase [Bradyrhizobium sp. ORS 285]|uniref:IS110 family transposase n=1 Tax=Bradyrhizobium sp. ORS 285 TaxID=115808 RepID=UPI00030E5D60|nr:IS110 family transposase [Bradyrhizobium sp. ORS 285]
MMTQIANGVAGIDVAKDKVDGCIRKLGVRQTFPSSSLGHRQLVALLRKHKVTKAVMEASGGYEREWAKALREAGIEVRIVIPNGFAASPCRRVDWRRTTR